MVLFLVIAEKSDDLPKVKKKTHLVPGGSAVKS